VLLDALLVLPLVLGRTLRQRAAQHKHGGDAHVVVLHQPRSAGTAHFCDGRGGRGEAASHTRGLDSLPVTYPAHTFVMAYIHTYIPTRNKYGIGENTFVLGRVDAVENETRKFCSRRRNFLLTRTRHDARVLVGKAKKKPPKNTLLS
jgi:hypothetical protein